MQPSGRGRSPVPPRQARVARPRRAWVVWAWRGLPEAKLRWASRACATPQQAGLARGRARRRSAHGYSPSCSSSRPVPRAAWVLWTDRQAVRSDEPGRLVPMVSARCPRPLGRSQIRTEIQIRSSGSFCTYLGEPASQSSCWTSRWHGASARCASVLTPSGGAANPVADDDSGGPSGQALQDMRSVLDCSARGAVRLRS